MPFTLWQDLTGPELDGLIRQDPVAVLVLAAVEQHGPHLPLATDLEIGRGIVRAAEPHLPDDLTAVLLPEQALGTSAEHLGFPGTLSLTPATLGASLRDLGAGLAAQGIRRLVLFNAHGGNKSVMDEVALGLRIDHGILVVKASWFRFRRPAGVDLPEDEWVHGLHGGAVETAMMLHLRPDLVRREAIQAFPSLGQELAASLRRLAPEGPASFAWTAADLSSSGVVGDARLATHDMGRRLVEHHGRELAAVIQDSHEFPLERLVPGGIREGAR